MKKNNKSRYKKKAEFGLNEALLSKESYDSTILNSRNKLLESQAQTQGLENAVSSFSSKVGIGPMSKVNNLTTLAGDKLTQNSMRKDGSVKNGQYAAGKSLKYAGMGASLGSFDPTGTTSAILAGTGAIAGGIVGAVESGKIERQNKNLIAQQKNIDNQFRLASTVKDRNQANQAKNGKKEITRTIETEGREPIFSPKDKNGNRELIYFNPNDPTHKEGGVKATVVKKSKYKMKSGNTNLVIPEESAIITAKGGKNKEALSAYKKGDKKKLEKIINEMPSDSPKKKADGDRKLKFKADTSKWDYNDVLPDTTNDLATVGANLGAFGTTGVKASSKLKSQSPIDKSTSPFSKDLFNKGLNSLLTSAPALYNTGKGLFGKVEKTERNMFTPDTMKYQDASDPLRRAAQEEYLSNREEIRRGSPNASSYLANAQMAANQRYKRKADIENTELQRRNDISNQNVNINNQARLTNLQLKNQYNDQDLQNKAVKDNYLATGLSQFSTLTQMNQLNKNRANSEDIALNMISSNNYKYNKNSKKVETYTKGSKNLKIKYKSKK